jgi:hypothetical protein
VISTNLFRSPFYFFFSKEQFCRQKHPQLSSLLPSPVAGKASLQSSDLAFRPLLLFIPLRPGQDRIREEYREGLKACLKVKQSLGIIGGKPKHALWFFGCQGNPSTNRQFN